MGNLLPFLIGDVGTLIKPRIHSHKFLWGRCQRICPQVIPILALVKTSWGSDSRCKSQKFNDTSTSWLKWKFQIFFQSNERLENPQPAAKLWGPATPCNRGPGQQFPLSSASQRCPSFCGVRWVQEKQGPRSFYPGLSRGLMEEGTWRAQQGGVGLFWGLADWLGLLKSSQPWSEKASKQWVQRGRQRLCCNC